MGNIKRWKGPRTTRGTRRQKRIRRNRIALRHEEELNLLREKVRLLKCINKLRDE